MEARFHSHHSVNGQLGTMDLVKDDLTGFRIDGGASSGSSPSHFRTSVNFPLPVTPDRHPADKKKKLQVSSSPTLPPEIQTPAAGVAHPDGRALSNSGVLLSDKTAVATADKSRLSKPAEPKKDGKRNGNHHGPNAITLQPARFIRQPEIKHPPYSEEESRLIKMSQGGGEKGKTAFSVFYDRYAEKIYKYIYFKIGNRSDTEDICNEVFLRAWSHIGVYKDNGRPFAAYLYRIAHNLVVDRFRVMKEDSPLDDAESLHDENRIEETVFSGVVRDTIAELLTHLSEDQRTVVELKLQGFSTLEITEIMHRKHNAVRTLLHRATENIRNRSLKQPEKYRLLFEF